MMSMLIEAAVGHSRTVLCSLILILIAGVVTFITIPKEADPDVNVPIIYVSLHHDGISPRDAERLLIRPVEQEVRTVEGVKEMTSTGYQGGGNVTLEFTAGFDADKALDDVRQAVDDARSKLPDGADEPTVNEVNIGLFPVLVVHLWGDLPERSIYQTALTLQNAIEALPTVLEANIAGEREELIEVIIDPKLLESYNLQYTDVLNLVRRSNQLVAAGNLDSGKGRFAIKVPGLFETVDDIMSMPIKASGEAVVLFQDVAEIRRTFKDPDGFARFNGASSLSLEIVKRTGENVIETIQAVQAVVDVYENEFPSGLKVTFSQDKSDQIRSMLRDLQNNVLSAILLIMIVIVAVLGVGSGLLVGFAIPASFLIGILVLGMMGLTVNIVVLFALILAVGMLVDGAIVVTESADRRMNGGQPRVRAFADAAKQMAWPITASTATTLAAFLPLLFWPGIVGEFMKFLPITLIATLSASLLVALIFLPTLGSVSIGPLTSAALSGLAATIIGGIAASTIFGGLTGTLIGFVMGTGVAVIVGVVTVRRHISATPPRPPEDPLAGGIDAVLSAPGFTGLYVRTLNILLVAPWAVVVTAFMMLVGMVFYFGQNGNGVEFFPDVEPENASVLVHARGNLSVWEQDALMRDVERRVIGIPGIRNVYTRTGLGAGAGGEAAPDVIGQLLVEFEDWDKRAPANDVLEMVRDRTKDIAGIKVEARKEEAGPPTGKAVQMELRGVNAAKLFEAAALMRERFESTPGLMAYEDNLPLPGIEWEIKVDRAEAAKFGLDVAAIGQSIQLITNGLKLSEYRPDDAREEIEIRIRFPVAYRNLEQLDQIRVETAQGSVPISNFVKRMAKPATGDIYRTGGIRSLTIKADNDPTFMVADGSRAKLPADYVEELKAWLEAEDPLPEGIEGVFRGEDEDQAEAQAFLLRAFAIALFIMAIILITQFNSFYDAMLILSAVILSIIGVLLGLMIEGKPFGIVMTGVGVIALAGIVVNNNIVLIDTYNTLRRSVPDPREAILRTGAQRLRPVLLTTITTILGLIPMVEQVNIDFLTREISVGAPSTQWWVGLATAVVYGLGFATILTLVVTPAALMMKANINAFLDHRVMGRPVAEPIAHPAE
jgi:multidrug efflux pump